MAQQRVQRRLAAIMAGDIAGYSRLMGRDEAGTARQLRDHLAAVHAVIERHHGRVVKTMGDGLLIEFPSAVAAVEGAITLQRRMERRNARQPADRRMLFRIGVNLSDVLVQGDELVDAEKGGHIWAERYDRRMDDIFAVQDEITGNIVASIEPHLYAREGYRAASKPPENVDLWGLVVRAIALVNQFGRRDNEEAQRLLHRALAIDPRYARAHAVLSWALWWATLYHYIEDREAAYAESARHAQEAVKLDASEPWARLMQGLNLSTAGQHDRALAEHQAALALNPNFALGRTTYGWALLRAGRFDDAIAETAKASRQSSRAFTVRPSSRHYTTSRRAQFRPG